MEQGGRSADAAFRALLDELAGGRRQAAALRPELTFEDMPPPRTLAPYAAALAATLQAGGDEVATGRFVLLYDPAGQPGWAGPLRVIVYIRAELDPEIAADPLVGEVGWSWLIEALERTGGYEAASGTVTRVVTEGFGGKAGEPPVTGFELRASWSPVAAGDRSSQGGAGAAAPGAGETAGTAPGTGETAGTPPGTGETAGTAPGAGETAGAALAAPGPEGTAGAGLAGHVTAWCNTMCAASGLPPLTAGVTALRARS
ncbi:MAG: DUF3000 family protein [Actinobacteria bacterium]|nr:DUF3000 family protein [Actinomycetota bacterium]